MTSFPKVTDNGDGTFTPSVNATTTTGVVGAGTAATAERVTLASDDPLVAKATGPTTGTISSVNDTNADGTILALNASRKGATFFNDSTVILYLALASTTASSTNYTAQVGPGGYYELPVCQGGVYTGVVKGIWASDASGSVKVTEFT